MSSSASDRSLKELVIAVLAANDTQLNDRACRALGLLLAERDDAADRFDLFEWC
jgi:hypothetical protein